MNPKSYHLPSTTCQLPLIVIVGPTASGKTSLAVEMASRFDGEIICADSRSVYKHMDIGTAKPSQQERKQVVHWGLDLVEPGEYFSAADFKDYADKKIKEIRDRGKIPFLVGGTGLYIDSVLFDYKFGPPADNSLRSKLQHMSLDELYVYCKKNEIILPENYKNKRYVIRSIEKNGVNTQKRDNPLTNSIIVGITTERDTLRTRIVSRTEQLFNDGVVDETKLLGEKYGWENEAMKSNIYPLVHQYLEGEMTICEVKERFAILDWRLAKRQLTWLRRDKFIRWFPIDDAKKYIASELAIRD